MLAFKNWPLSSSLFFSNICASSAGSMFTSRVGLFPPDRGLPPDPPDAELNPDMELTFFAGVSRSRIVARLSLFCSPVPASVAIRLDQFG